MLLTDFLDRAWNVDLYDANNCAGAPQAIVSNSEGEIGCFAIQSDVPIYSAIQSVCDHRQHLLQAMKLTNVKITASQNGRALELYAGYECSGEIIASTGIPGTCVIGSIPATSFWVS